jgi:hypothetical protein
MLLFYLYIRNKKQCIFVQYFCIAGYGKIIIVRLAKAQYIFTCMHLTRHFDFWLRSHTKNIDSRDIVQDKTSMKCLRL